ncbi:MAG: autotransporter-associated beta strand repeat-containing protein, partial [Morganella morganii]
GDLDFYVNVPLTYSGNISGTGFLVAAANPLILTGNNTYTGGTIIAGGTLLQIGNGGSSGTLGTGGVTGSGTLAFDLNNSVTFDQVMSGSNNLQQEGTGTLIITGANTYSGNTTVTAGTLQVGNGGTTGTLGTGTVVNNAILTIDESGSYALSSIVSDSGGITGNGTFSITGNGLTLDRPISQGGAITLTADTMSFAAITISSPDTLTIQPLSNTTSVGLGTGVGTLSLPAGLFLGSGRVFQDGFSLITIGNNNTTANMTVNNSTQADIFAVSDPLSLVSGSGQILINGGLDTWSYGHNDLTLNTSSGIRNFNYIAANNLSVYNASGTTLISNGHFYGTINGNTYGAFSVRTAGGDLT